MTLPRAPAVACNSQTRSFMQGVIRLITYWVRSHLGPDGEAYDDTILADWVRLVRWLVGTVTKPGGLRDSLQLPRQGTLEVGGRVWFSKR